ncbi:hypothetical protein WG67_05640 [Wolbachia endosymbiont of Drosophila incompta]|nr:hypothetical protein WG67_05640 [Wolbachia endosymbiont of Drosophila incompta]
MTVVVQPQTLRNLPNEKKGKRSPGVIIRFKILAFLCFKRLTSEIQPLLIATNLRCKCLRNLLSRKKDKESPS